MNDAKVEAVVDAINDLITNRPYWDAPLEDQTHMDPELRDQTRIAHEFARAILRAALIELYSKP